VNLVTVAFNVEYLSGAKDHSSSRQIIKKLPKLRWKVGGKGF